MIKKILIAMLLVAFALPSAAWAQTPQDSAAIITQLQAQLTALQAQVTVPGKQPTQTMPQQGRTFTQMLQRGATGDAVKALQNFLKQFPDVYPEGLVTGYYGALTEIAVGKFQKAQGLEQVGVVGPKTLAKLNALSATGGGSSGPVAVSSHTSALSSSSVSGATTTTPSANSTTTPSFSSGGGGSVNQAIQAPESGATTPSFSSSFSYPYPVTWTEGRAQLSIAGASFVQNNLTLSVNVSMGNTSECVPMNLKILLNESGDMAAPFFPSFVFPGSGGCQGTSRMTYAPQPFQFSVNSLIAPFLITTGGVSDIYFEVTTTTNGGMRVAVPQSID